MHVADYGFQVLHVCIQMYRLFLTVINNVSPKGMSRLIFLKGKEQTQALML